MRESSGKTSRLTDWEMASRAIFSCRDHALRVWDLESGQCLRILKGHTDKVSSVSVTHDGKRAVSSSGDHTLRVWDLESDQYLAAFHVNSRVTALEVKANGLLVCGTDDGNVLAIMCRWLQVQPPLATPVRMWLHEEQRASTLRLLSTLWKNGGRWDDSIKTACLWCGGRFRVHEEILDLIRVINRNNNLSPNQSPCLDLPKEAWDEPRLLSECPLCHKPLKFNPFVVDNRTL